MGEEKWALLGHSGTEVSVFLFLFSFVQFYESSCFVVPPGHPEEVQFSKYCDKFSSKKLLKLKKLMTVSEVVSSFLPLLKDWYTS